MREFVQSLASRLGTDEGAARAATGRLHCPIGVHARPADAAEVSSASPGAPRGGDAAPCAIASLAEVGSGADALGASVHVSAETVRPGLGDALLGRLLAKVPGLPRLTR